MIKVVAFGLIVLIGGGILSTAGLPVYPAVIVGGIVAAIIR